jgi:crotonobetainyl-CoA:carnitine CoA-transferase CaiB-like acyl-CoA transferase
VRHGEPPWISVVAHPLQERAGGRVTDAHGPLSGVRVLEIAHLLAGPFAGKLLCDYGAEVVKVEDVGKPDASRSWSPKHEGVALGFLRVNSNKSSVAINLRDPRGRDVILNLVPRFDVIIESFRPGRMEEWGLGSAQLRQANPRVIVLHVSGYGQTGTYRERPGFGTVAEAMAGFSFVTGWAEMPPTTAPFGLGDQVAGMAGAFAVCASLVQAERTGQGEDIDVALYEPLMHMLGDSLMKYSTSGEIDQRSGSMGKNTSPRGVYRTRDGGWIALAGSTQAIVERLFTAMGRSELIEDARFATNEMRVAHNEELQPIVVSWVASQDRSEVLAQLEKFQVVAGPINDARDLVNDPVLRDRSSIVDLHSSALGDIAVPGLLAKMESFGEPERGDAPRHGEHTLKVLQGELGMSSTQLEELERAGVVHLG